jgi:glycosyltransferase EpsE
MIGKISVIMGIYNCANTLREAIESILDQTYNNWELILCDDGSTDTTFDIASEYQRNYPNKIKRLSNPQNMGLNATLNRCLEVADGEYIARQDGDDASMADRLASEVVTLENRSDLAFVSTAMVLFDQAGKWGVTRPLEYPAKENLMQAGVFAHAASMMRREAILAVGGYSESKWLMRVEDYHLWYKMYKAGYRGANIQEPLYRCRDGRDAANRRKYKFRLNECYVKWLIFHDLNLSIRYLPQVFRPLIVGILPRPLYNRLHRRGLRY